MCSGEWLPGGCIGPSSRTAFPSVKAGRRAVATTLKVDRRRLGSAVQPSDSGELLDRPFQVRGPFGAASRCLVMSWLLALADGGGFKGLCDVVISRRL